MFPFAVNQWDWVGGWRKVGGREGEEERGRKERRVLTHYKRTKRQGELTQPLAWWVSLTATVHDPCELTKKHKPHQRVRTSHNTTNKRVTYTLLQTNFSVESAKLSICFVCLNKNHTV